MNRSIIAVLIGIVVIGGLVGGYFAVDYYTTDRTKLNVNANPAPPPMTWEEMEALQAKGPDAADQIPRLIDCFATDDANIRIQAAETLGKIGAKAVQPVCERLKDPDAKVRFLAVQTLALIGPNAAPAADDLLASAKDDDAQVRFKAIYALGQIGVNKPAVYKVIIEAMTDKDEVVRATSVEAIDKLGAPPKEAIPSLAKLATKNPQALKLLGKAGEPAAPALKDLLKSSEGVNQTVLIQTVAMLGSNAKTLLPELENMMIAKETWPAPVELMMTFKKCGTEGAASLTSVLKKLQDPKTKPAMADERSKLVLKAMGEMGADAKDAVPVLIVMLKDRERLRPEVLEALGGIGPAAKKAIPAVRELLKTPAIEPQARVALKRMGVVEK